MQLRFHAEGIGGCAGCRSGGPDLLFCSARELAVSPAIRQNDVAAVRRALSSGRADWTVDDTGTTLLMYVPLVENPGDHPTLGRSRSAGERVEPIPARPR